MSGGHKFEPTLQDAVDRLEDYPVKLLTVAVNRHLQDEPDARLKALHDILADEYVDRGFAGGGGPQPPTGGIEGG